MINLDNVIAAEIDVTTRATKPYLAPSKETASDQATTIASLQAATLALANKIKTVTANYTALPADKTILVNATTAAVTIALPAAAANSGVIYAIKKIDASANNVTIDPNGTETVDGALTRDITSQWMCLTIQSNGTGWFII